MVITNPFATLPTVNWNLFLYCTLLAEFAAHKNSVGQLEDCVPFVGEQSFSLDGVEIWPTGGKGGALLRVRN